MAEAGLILPSCPESPPDACGRWGQASAPMAPFPRVLLTTWPGPVSPVMVSGCSFGLTHPLSVTAQVQQQKLQSLYVEEQEQRGGTPADGHAFPGKPSPAWNHESGAVAFP